MKGQDTDMPIRIYNTLGRKKEEFVPVQPGKVGMYVCGPTVYDSSHIGHARSVVVFDVIARYFRSEGFEVKYVRNFTDVDDKIIAKANQTGMDCQAVSEKYIKEFYEDMDALHVLRATVEPKATEHIPQIIGIVQKLIDRNIAYTVDGDVYFSVSSFKDYGRLSGRKLEDMEAGARVEVDERKRNPFDFSLWKAAKPGEPSWDSPWGKGRPGWHIECSAMSETYLGQTFDIHGGGKDLIFPHHENEIAQSEAASGKPFAKYWMHNGFVNINQEKMSKSLGNFLMIKDVLKVYHPEAIRLFLLSNHYRSPIDFTDKIMDEATVSLDKIYAAIERTEEFIQRSEKNGDSWHKFAEAMDDDFNTAKGIGILFDAVRNINRLMDEHSGNIADDSRKILETELSDILKMGDILGILTESPKAYFEKRRSSVLQKKSVDPAMIEQMIADRASARKSKNWAKADEIRKKLESMNVILEDRPDGTVWKMGG